MIILILQKSNRNLSFIISNSFTISIINKHILLIIYYFSTLNITIIYFIKLLFNEIILYNLIKTTLLKQSCKYPVKTNLLKHPVKTILLKHPVKTKLLKHPVKNTP